MFIWISVEIPQYSPYEQYMIFPISAICECIWIWPLKWSDRKIDNFFVNFRKNWANSVPLAPWYDRNSSLSFLSKFCRNLKKINSGRFLGQKCYRSPTAPNIKTITQTFAHRIRSNPLTWSCTLTYFRRFEELNEGKSLENVFLNFGSNPPIHSIWAVYDFYHLRYMRMYMNLASKMVGSKNW